MNRRRVAFGVLAAWAGLSLAGRAQTPPEDRREVPAWLQFGVELRARAEWSGVFDSPAAANVYLTRFRLNVAAQPEPWLRFFVQGQDARAFTPSSRDIEDLQNTLDLRLAYVDIGRPEQGWRFRAGRQELALGDERLLSADNYWDCFGQAFDAVRVGFVGAKFRVDAFTGFRVQPARRRLDPFETDDRISGLTAQFPIRREGVVEPYVLWKRGRDGEGRRDVLTPGVRVVGGLPRNLDYNVEMAIQGGRVAGDGIAAWAGHWELGWKPGDSEPGLHMAVEYNYASGDKNPNDKTYGVFDDLYSSDFNEYGLSDPVVWRNIRYPAAGVEIPLAKRWTLSGGYRRYWLATVRDAFYPGGDGRVIRNPAATSAYVGSHALASIEYNRSDRWRIHAGYGRLFAGDYLRQSGYPSALTTAHLGISFTH